VLFAGLHVAINWGWIVSVFKKRLSNPKQRNKAFSPGIVTIALRTSIIIGAACIVSFALYGILGRPSVDRLYDHDEVARFKPTLGHGIIQFLGETFLIAMCAFIARKWLRIKL